ncbi:hypothetical protein ISCGN_016214 [Ixodes scapularis]
MLKTNSSEDDEYHRLNVLSYAWIWILFSRSYLVHHCFCLRPDGFIQQSRVDLWHLSKLQGTNNLKHSGPLDPLGQVLLCIRVLGLPIDEDGGASTWLAQVTKAWRQTLGLIRRATSKSWGANECTLRMLVHALLTSKAMYGINYLRVTGAQKRKLEVLNREAMRVVTGLPRFAPIEELQKHSKINTLEDRAEIHRIAQVQRLERTRPGRAILQLLGYQLMGRPAISPPPPPWEDEAVVDHRPMKQNVDKDQKGRRNNAAKKHAESVQDVRPGSKTVHVYTDAAVTEDGGGTAIAWFCLNTESKANFAFHKKHSTKEAELRAILFAVEDESLTPEGSKHLRVYTDSKEALATCLKRNSPSKTVKKIKARAKTLKSRGVKITISWVPGHAGIEGNERAHEAARELIPSPYPPATGQSAILDNPPPALIQDDSDDEEEPDWDEEATLARLERKRVLRNKLPEDDDPLPNGPDIQKINYEGKMFILHLMFPEDIKAKKKHLMGFKCPTQTACHHLWRCAVEQRYFFTVPSSSEVPSVTTGGGLFSRGSRFRYSGRVEREVMDDMKNIRRDPPQFQRTLTRPPSFRCKTTASIAAPSLSPSRAATEDSPLREMMHPTMADQTLRAAAPLDCGDGYLPDDAKRPADPHELLDSADDEEDGVPLPLARPPNHDLRVDLTPSQSSTTVAAPPDAPLTPETQSPEPPFDPQSTPECGPELEARLRGSGCAWHATGGTRPRLALVAWLALPLVLLWCLFVALMEWDWPPLSDMRRLPELVLVRRQYYEPTKEALFAWIRGTPEET